MTPALLAVAATSAAFIIASPVLAFGAGPGAAILAVVVGIGGMVALVSDALASVEGR
jgi:hypothetical protein